MSFSELFIRRPATTILVMTAILFFGILAFISLPVSDMPSVDYPTIQVTTSFPGASPDIIANTVTAPLERQFTTLRGIQSISSNSNTGTSTIVLQFDLDRNIDGAGADVQAAINQVQPLLPPTLPYNPTYTKVNPTANPIIYYVLASPSLTLGDLYKWGYSYIGERLAMTQGVSQVFTWGPNYAVRVQVNPDLLAAKSISLDQVANTLANGNPFLATGTLFGPDQAYNVDVNGGLYNAQGYNSLIIKTNNGAFTRISDVGLALDSLDDDKVDLKYMKGNIQDPCIVLAIRKQEGANSIAVIRKIKALLPNLLKGLPTSITFAPVYDQSEFIEEAVHDVEFTLLIALLLVVFVIFFYLGKLTDTLIPSIAIPMIVTGTFSVMYVLGFSIDILSLLAITLSIGFLVDDAIVVLENIVRHVELGEKPFIAAIRGSRQITFTIVSMTTCLIAVFIPLLFMGGVIGRIFREFAVTIVVAVAISGFISLTLTPMLCSLFVAEHSKSKKKNFMERLSKKINIGLLNLYKRGLETAFRFPIFVLAGGVACIVFSILLFKILPKDFLPADDLGFFTAYTLSSDDTSPFLMIEYQKKIAEIIRNDPNVEDLVTIAGYPNSNYGICFVGLKSASKRKPMPRVIKELQAKTSQIPGVNTYYRPEELIVLDIGTGNSRGQYQYTLQSLDPDHLYKAAATIIERMQKVRGFGQVSSDMEIHQLNLTTQILRDTASDLNLTAHQVEQALYYAYSGNRVTTINAPENQYNVVLEVIPNAYKDPSVLDKLYLTSSKGDLVPLSQVISVKETTGPAQINHFDTLPSVTISFSLTTLSLGNAIKEIDTIAKEVLTKDVLSSAQGSASAFLAAFASLKFLFLITIFIIYIVLGILYENFIHPFTVMSALPPATFGAFLTLYILGSTLSLYAFVGIFMLLGIVLKNGIMMIDFANVAHKEGKSLQESITYACLTRFRPILMTTFAAMMGALPIALGVGGLTAQSRRSLGYAIVGGLIISQLLTLFLTPVVYIYLERMREAFNQRFKPRIADDNSDIT